LGLSSNERDLEPDLRGNTLRVYWYMLSSDSSVGVREVQRAIGMSSPSVASHHLTKLESLELIEKNPDNTYQLKKLVKVGVLQNFIAFRGIVLPRYSFIAVFFSVYTLVYFIMTLGAPLSLFDRYIGLTVGLVGAIFAWFETYRLWKLKFS
jgi:DNA-binding transcriptional ArsR family regulator